MRAMNKTTVVLAAMVTFASFGCGSGEARHTARAPSLDTAGTTRTTSAALTTRVTTTSTTTNGSSATPTASVPKTTSTANAVMRVATESCDRAAACKQIGAGRAFGDRDECVNAIGHDIVTSLSDDACPSGVDAERLAACASEVQASACEDGSKSIANPPSCARERLCRGGDVAQTQSDVAQTDVQTQR